KEYVRFFNKKFEGTDDYTELDRLEEILENVRDDLCIPFSYIHFSNIESCFDPERLVELVNEWVDEYSENTPRTSPDSSPHSSPRIPPASFPEVKEIHIGENSESNHEP